MKHIPTKKLTLMLATISISLPFSSCATYSTIQHAKGKYNKILGKEPKKATPASYILLPGSAAVDVVTSTFQLLLYTLYVNFPTS